MGTVLLEVTVLVSATSPGPTRAAPTGCTWSASSAACRPEPNLVSAVCRESDVPVFVLLRLNDSWTTTGGELTRLVGLAEDYLSCGATGVSFGFLDADLEIDTEVCEHLATSLPEVPWTFHRAVDATLDPRRAWRPLLRLPGLVHVRSAGSPRGCRWGTTTCSPPPRPTRRSPRC